tara:strand:+ start:655 stop:825 length:171 start_codon:yes stop_codon:yes gene_type:complete
MFNKTATAVGLSLGAISSASADSNMTDTITELFPVIVELVIIIAMLGYIMRLLKKL